MINLFIMTVVNKNLLIFDFKFFLSEMMLLKIDRTQWLIR